MDSTIIKLKALYDDMFKELTDEVDALDGVIEEFNPDDKIISITVAPDLREYLEKVIVDITDKYDTKKAKIYKQDPFYGVKVILSS